ncbi:hypothetical protein BH10BAC3_BH10BAC3_16000 [soil metagenome]
MDNASKQSYTKSQNLKISKFFRYFSSMAQPRTSNRYASVIIVVLLLLALVVVKTCKSRFQSNDRDTTQTTTNTSPKESKGLNRNPSAINYSKHARCRMACRHIDDSEVKDILQTGKINYGKSEIGDSPDCKKKYAVEGETRDKQKVRIIFAPCQSEVTVVTVIDLGTEWKCDCE